MLVEFPSIWFALTSALLFAFGVQFQNLGVASVPGRSGALISTGSSTLFSWLLAPFLLDSAYWVHPSIWIFVLVGLFRPSVSSNLAVAAVRHLGPTLSSTLASTSPLFGAFFGVLLLGESLSWTTALGTLGIVSAVVMLARRDSRVVATWPIWALGLPVGAAAIRSVGHVLTKVGMEGIPDPYFAGLVSFSVSALVMLALHRLRPDARAVAWRTRGPYWFVAAGVTMAIAVLSLNHALIQGQIVTVVPIVACSPVFTMLLSIVLFRREKLSLRIVLAVLIVVPSVIGIALGF